jgi:hypothetical protein
VASARIVSGISDCTGTSTMGSFPSNLVRRFPYREVPLQKFSLFFTLSLGGV